MKVTNYLLIIPIIIISLASCDKNNAEPEKDKMFAVASEETIDGKFLIELMTVDSVFEGYNKVYFKIIDKSTNNAITSATIELYPEMDMMTMKHSAPFENPPLTANLDGYFEGAVVFIMPSSGDMGWTLKTTVTMNDVTDEVILAIPKVLSLEEPKKINVISGIDETKYFISVVEPINPQVGINNLELAVHYKASMMSFPAAEDLTIEIEPEMPSMDHGSPNNEHPVHVSNGHYVGKVNFTMSGWWRVNLVIKKDGAIVKNDTYIDITF